MENRHGNEMLRARFNDYVAGTLDVNTALSRAEEEINKMIEAEKMK